MRLLLFAVVLMFAARASAEPQTYSFSWTGAGGYSMQGALSFDNSLLSGPIVLRDDVSCFVIEGFFDGDPIGRWGLGMLTPETSWRLHFSPVQRAFVTEGYFIDMPQAWNMNGSGTDCGEGGFGFNLGNIGQDLCLSNVMVEESRISPYEDFPATLDPDFVFPEDACRGVMILSQHVTTGAGAG